MTDPVEEEVARLLATAERGDRAALDALFPLVYDELRRLASRERRHLPGNATLNTTALVHEAYLKLADRPRTSWESRVHFLATAARAMRQILIDYARRRHRKKRGGGAVKIALEDLEGAAAPGLISTEDPALLLAFDEALRELERVNARQSRIVECLVFGGMTIAETAAALGTSTASISRGWAVARARLHRALTGDS